MKIHTAFVEGNGQTGTEDRSLKHKELASREHTGHGFAFLRVAVYHLHPNTQHFSILPMRKSRSFFTQLKSKHLRI